MAGYTASAGSVDWETPEQIIALSGSLWSTLGRIWLDPCASPTSRIGQMNWTGPPNDKDGLKEPWEALTAYVNPPFGNSYRHAATGVSISAKEHQDLAAPVKGCYQKTSILDWAEKWVTENKRNQIEVVALTPANVDTALWHKWIFPHASAICFIKGRLYFSGGKLPAPMACALSYYGMHSEKFERLFSSLGRVVLPGAIP